MGEKIRAVQRDPEELRRFTQHLLDDLTALERLVEKGGIESGVRRLGAEQEVFLVDEAWRPASIGEAVLAEVDDDHFTTELARFNLEFNLEPLPLTGAAFSQLEEDLDRHLSDLRRAARKHGGEVVLVGILPTLTSDHLTLDHMTPVPRYLALNSVLKQMRGEDFEFRIKGRDSLRIRHDNLMLEACNTSFQVHLQVSADEFARKYNLAQLLAAPVLGVATNSPILLDRQLWSETRIALFQQATDDRPPSDGLRRSQPRVSFGSRWVDSSITEIFREDIARFRVLLGEDTPEDAVAKVEAGEAPELYALRQHNGTVYRWNRPCYGVSDGQAHLRIENRVLPAGPTVVDEVANAAFWLGLMEGADSAYGDIAERLPFDSARRNFLAAARRGLATEVEWTSDRRLSMRELIVDELLPLAHQGLASLDVASEDRQRYLGIIEKRATSGRSGSRWMCDFADELSSSKGLQRPAAALVAGLHRRQTEGSPVHTWDSRRNRRERTAPDAHAVVMDLMSRDLITVGPDDPVELVASIMRWRRIRHLPVEDHRRRLLGLVSERSLLRLVACRPNQATTAADIMSRELITVTPKTPLYDAIALLKLHRVSCLPVVDDEFRAVGILSERDLIAAAAPVLETLYSPPPETEPEG